MVRKRAEMVGHKTSLRPEGIRLLLAGQSASQVAEALGVHPNTVKRWKASEAYSDANTAKTEIVHREIRDDAINVGKVAADCVRVFQRRLAEILSNPDATIEDSAEAANIFRTLGIKVADEGDTVERSYGELMERIAARRKIA